MILKRNREGLKLAKERNQLIDRDVVLQQLAYILGACKSILEPLPRRFARKFGLSADHPQVRYLEQAIRETLEQMAAIPDCAEPDRLKRLEEEKEAESS